MSGSIRNIIIIFVLVVAALAAGIKGFVHHKYKENIDKGLRMAEGVALIRYSDFSTSLLSGSLALQGITISSPYLPSDLNIDKLEVQTPGPVFMIKAAKSLQAKEFPKKMGVHLQGLQFDLSDGLGIWLDSLMKRIDPVYRPYQKLCNGKTIMGPSDWKEMGYTRMVVDADIDYHFDESAKTFNVTVDETIREMGRARVSFDFSGPASPSMAGFMQGGPPKMGKLSFTVQDKSYMSRQVKYCAGLSKMEKAEYIKAMTEQPGEYYFATWGINPGAGLRQAWGEYLANPDTIQVTVEPSSDFNMALLENYQASDIPSLLNMSVMINNKQVDDLGFTLPDPQFQADLTARMMSAMDMNSLMGIPQSGSESTFKETEIPAFKQREVVKPKYYTVALNGIEQYQGERVRIKTRSGQEREGILIKTDKTTLFVERRVHSGKFTMQVARKEIDSIEAWLVRK